VGALVQVLECALAAQTLKLREHVALRVLNFEQIYVVPFSPSNAHTTGTFSGMQAQLVGQVKLQRFRSWSIIKMGGKALNAKFEWLVIL
jgi:hypothetical protein